MVHIHAEWHTVCDENGDSTRVAVVDNKSGLIVIRPDVLLTGTAVVGSMFCMRKAVLSERFKGIEGPTRQMLVGTLGHRLLQTVS